ncbi:MAG: sigma-70 family RNA polymerase sigma factor [Candidatus Solibacter usitatus]|nr:sigma-70 family RNA polymerase sigma factor [Candidatus Solibacter usitatus]
MRVCIRKHLREQDPEDLVHEALIGIVECIQSGGLRDSAALGAFVEAVVRRQVAGKILVQIRRRKYIDAGRHTDDLSCLLDNPEAQASQSERSRMMRQGLLQLVPRDSEILTRFYLHDEGREQICREMKLTANQFRLYKTRAKARLTAWTQSANLALTAS